MRSFSCCSSFVCLDFVAGARIQHLVGADAGSLHALLALLGNEGDVLTLLEGLEAVLLLGASVIMFGGEWRHMCAEPCAVL